MGTKFLPLFRCITSKRLVVLCVALLAIAFVATPAFAQAPPPLHNCIQNEWNTAQGDSLNCTSGSCSLVCTANDVQVAAVINVRDPVSGNQLVNCTANQPFSFIADFEIVTTSKSTRSNIGLYIAENGTTVADALSVNNTCADNLIPPPAGFVNRNTTGKKPTVGAPGQFPCALNSNILCGTDYFDEFDGPPDNCGDSSSSDDGKVNGLATAGAQQITLGISGFTCPDPSVTTLPTCTVNGVTGPCAVLPNCTSWQVPGKQLGCTAPTGQQSYNLNATPGDKSKCNCEVITLPILVQTPVIAVNKTCSTIEAGNTPVACSSGTEGVDEVTYTITVTNNSNVGNLSLSIVKDSVYGQIYPTGAASFTGDSNSGCTPTTFAVGASSVCTFTAHKYGDPAVAAVTDSATASGTSQFDGTWGPQGSNTVTVTPTEASAAATVTKGLGSPNLTAGCATANFTVDVHNTSNATYTVGSNTVTADEGETLMALADSVYTGGITSLTPGVLGTTCGVASGSPGLGTLSGSTGGGTLPASLPVNGHYTCEFNAQFCGTLTSIEDYGTGVCSGSVAAPGNCTAGLPPATVCTSNAQCDVNCLGLEHINQVTATITDDDSEGNVVTTTANTLTTHVCLNAVTKP